MKARGRQLKEPSSFIADRLVRAALAGCVATLILASAAIARAAPSGQAGELLLEIWVNGATHHVVAHVIDRDGALWVSHDDLAAAGIKLDASQAGADGLVAINKLDGVRAEVESGEQRLVITTAEDHLASQAYDLRSPATGKEPTSATGFIASYDVVGTVGDFSHWHQTAGLAGAFGGTLFTPLGTLTSTGFGQWQDSNSRFVRLDTTAEIDQPDALRRWLFGDAISGGLVWSRSVRFAGLQVGTDFSLRPELATLPLPAFFGQTAVPGTVDVYVNSARVFEGDIQPGPFEINNLPIVTGSGQATVVIRDVLGGRQPKRFPSMRRTRCWIGTLSLRSGFGISSPGLRPAQLRLPRPAGGGNLSFRGDGLAHARSAWRSNR